MRDLNHRFRGKNSTTDVLSFPASSHANGTVGDIAISLDLAAKNARRLGHSVSDEARILVLHGILHLAGYDHEGDNGEMAARELQLRRQLGLPEALIERVSARSSKNSHPNHAKNARSGGHTRRPGRGNVQTSARGTRTRVRP
jgi:probable rRNA maturation factor